MVFPSLNATMLLLYCRSLLVEWLGELRRQCLAHGIKQGWLIAFYGQQVIALLLDNGLGNLGLTSHRINGDEAPFDIEKC
ncbi:hypothetical protein BHG40_14850 [Aeromonas salmonicida subsp. masoucida]|nr:hypothetical protein BHG40_14850 [Aeromonas salmonicida subsp. masoucida]